MPAGERGRGFAVVADEVRMLSPCTQDQIKEILQIIGRLVSSTGNANEKHRVFTVPAEESDNPNAQARVDASPLGIMNL
ncbi:methyl-accepting chemotaxis protein [Vibrio lentus]|nr:methyl-accepting chemotaxis protein [Vibrio lentus]